MLDQRKTPISGPNPLCPDRMAGDARLAEIGRILAVGVVRLCGAKSSDLPAENGDSSVDFPLKKSGGRHVKRIRIGGIDEAPQ